MPKHFSQYLNLLRCIAACLVFGVHATSTQFGLARIALPLPLGHRAVIAFFVLSGYVISHVAHKRENRLTDFAASRAARILSVAVPALAVTVLVDVVLLSAHLGSNALLDDMRPYQLHQLWKYLPLFLTFTTDIWFLRENALSDVPYWSLCYEVWFYVAFATLTFVHGPRRWLGFTAAALVGGPRLWLLFPVWLMGVAVEHAHRSEGGLSTSGFPLSGGLGQRSGLSPEEGSANARRWPLVLFATSLAALVAICGLGLDVRLDALTDRLSGGWMQQHLRYAQFFPGDYVCGALVALNIHAARFTAPKLGPLGPAADWLAARSFTLYLLHFPLLEFWAAALPGRTAAVLAAVLLCLAALAPVTEMQKGALRRALLPALKKVFGGNAAVGAELSGTAPPR